MFLFDKKIERDKANGLFCKSGVGLTLSAFSVIYVLHFCEAFEIFKCIFGVWNESDFQIHLSDGIFESDKANVSNLPIEEILLCP